MRVNNKRLLYKTFFLFVLCLGACSGQDDESKTATFEYFVREAENELLVTVTFEALVEQSMEELLRNEAATIQAIPTSTPTFTDTAVPTLASSPTQTLIPTATATPLPSSTPTLAPLPTATANCDPSYPTLCLEPGMSDLDCDDIAVKNFPVRSPDPHNFDKDNDGFGCES